jgi:site-specific recombinase XerD
MVGTMHFAACSCRHKKLSFARDEASKMIERVVLAPYRCQRLHGGLFGPYLDGFASRMETQGYVRLSAKERLRFVEGFGHYLLIRGIKVGQIRDEHVRDFCQRHTVRCRQGAGVAKTIVAFVAYLREIGVVAPAATRIDRSPMARIGREFAAHLRNERGLVETTIYARLIDIRRFLLDRFGDGKIALRQIRPSDITGFVLRRAQAVKPAYAKLTVTALRSFCQFLRMRGDVDTDLAAFVPSVKHVRFQRVPRFISAADVRRILRRCDRASAVGKRDFAILLVISRLGLRAAEVVAMRLDDIDWEAGEMVVRGKGLRQDRLPLPHDVGQALATYIRSARPRCASRHVFLKVRAPWRELDGSPAIWQIVSSAIRRAGLKPANRGPHLLRHSLATTLLSRGSRLDEVGELLRHRHPDTTAIYAKVELDALRPLALPWPEAAR